MNRREKRRRAEVAKLARAKARRSARILLGTSLLFLLVAVAVAVVAVQQSEATSGARGDAPDIAVGDIPTSGNWSAGAGSDGLRADIGSTGGGRVRPDGTTGICVHVAGADRSHLKGAVVQFSTDRGTLSKPKGVTDVGGIVCTDLTAPDAAGQLRVSATIDADGYDQLLVSNTVEVVGDSRRVAQGPDLVLLGVAAVLALAGGAFLAVSLVQRRRMISGVRPADHLAKGESRRVHWREKRRRRRNRHRT